MRGWGSCVLGTYRWSLGLLPCQPSTRPAPGMIKTQYVARFVGECSGKAKGVVGANLIQVGVAPRVPMLPAAGDS
jgi:hypothetical protein